MLAPRKHYYRTHFEPECYLSSTLNNQKNQVLLALSKYITDKGAKSEVLTELTVIQKGLPAESQKGSYKPKSCSNC
jgi:predicted Zn-ribbon and HTH transcriptional regulator